MMKSEREYSLGEVSRLLGQPQHKLIYLCEKGAVLPDFGEALGRGSSRRFSARNLLEFAIALKLREILLPAAVISAVLHVLREFEKRVRAELPGFELPSSLQKREASTLIAVITDGPRLYFALGRGNGPEKVFGGIDLSSLISPAKRKAVGSKTQAASGRRSKVKSLTFQERSVHKITGFAEPEQTKLEVNITAIAKGLQLE